MTKLSKITLSKIHAACAIVSSVAMTVTAAGVVFAVLELEESKKATSARITMDYGLSGARMLWDVSNENFVTFITKKYPSFSREEQLQATSGFMAYLVWHQTGLKIWKDDYLADRSWEGLKIDLCLTVRHEGARKLLSGQDSNLRKVLDVELFELIDECLRNPDAFIAASWRKIKEISSESK